MIFGLHNSDVQGQNPCKDLGTEFPKTEVVLIKFDVLLNASLYFSWDFRHQLMTREMHMCVENVHRFREIYRNKGHFYIFFKLLKLHYVLFTVLKNKHK